MLSTPSPHHLHPREVEIRALSAMEAEVRAAGSGVPPLIKGRTAEDRQVLQHIAQIIVADVPPPLAMTDPARYRKLARLRAELILRGYHSYFQQLTLLA